MPSNPYSIFSYRIVSSQFILFLPPVRWTDKANGWVDKLIVKGYDRLKLLVDELHEHDV
jgi:hypothetical protein